MPETKPTPHVAPKPIFPWEHERPPQKPTRVFAEDLPPSTPEKPSTPTLTLTPTRDEGDRGSSPPPEEIVQEDQIRQEPFAPTKNAWDDVVGIERYVRAVLGAQNRGKPKAPTVPAGLEGMGIMSPDSEGIPESAFRSNRAKRKESLILTDFPSAVERPSLPVTPAPIKRPTFWGEERDPSGEGKGVSGGLPAAEGVPDQIDWVCPSCGFVAESPFAFARVRRAPERGLRAGGVEPKDKEILDLESIMEAGAERESTWTGATFGAEEEQQLPGIDQRPLVSPPSSSSVVEPGSGSKSPLPSVQDSDEPHSRSAEPRLTATSTAIPPSIPVPAPAPLPPPPDNTGPFWYPSYSPLRPKSQPSVAPPSS